MQMSIRELMNGHYQNGKLIYIGIRIERKKPLDSVQSIKALSGKGLEGDHYKADNGKRQVTLIQREHLQAVASYLNRREGIDPGLVRRNLVVSGINLGALKDRFFEIGDATFRYTGECHPCSRMEENLGPGGYNAMRGHGGITAAIIESGDIHVGDDLLVVDR